VEHVGLGSVTEEELHTYLGLPPPLSARRTGARPARTPRPSPAAAAHPPSGRNRCCLRPCGPSRRRRSSSS